MDNNNNGVLHMSKSLRDRIEYSYVNIIQSAVMESDIRLAFGDQGPGRSSDTSDPIAGIIMHPTLAKRLIMLLTEAVDQWEKNFGPIQTVKVDVKH